MGFKGRLHLDGRYTLEPAAIRALANCQGQELILAGPSELDAETARALAAATFWKGRLPGLASLDAATARAIAEFKGDVYERRLKSAAGGGRHR